MMNSISLYMYKVLSYYFALTALIGFLQMIGIEQSVHLYKLIMYPMYIIAIISILKGLSNYETLLFIIIIIISLSSLLNDYPWELYRTGITGELIPMLFFLVGKNCRVQINAIFEKAIVPVLIVGCSGFLLYIYQPYWYVAFRLSRQSVISEYNILEMSRLSAFWEYPYWISYASAILFYYLLCKYLKMGKIEIKWKLISLFLIIILFLTQQRGPLGFVLVSSFVIFLVIARKREYCAVRKLLIQLAIVIVLTFICTFSLFSEDILDFMINKIGALFDSSDSGQSFLQSRAAIFSDFYKKEITLFGDGIGKYSHAALFLDMLSITDQQYLKMIYETGYFGFFSRILFILLILINGIKKIHYKYFDVGIIIMYLITMLGADSLALSNTHNCIFWLCCGRICNKRMENLSPKKNYRDMNRVN